MKKYIKPIARIVITESVILAGSQQFDVDTTTDTDVQYSKEYDIWHWMAND